MKATPFDGNFDCKLLVVFKLYSSALAKTSFEPDKSLAVRSSSFPFPKIGTILAVRADERSLCSGFSCLLWRAPVCKRVATIKMALGKGTLRFKLIAHIPLPIVDAGHFFQLLRGSLGRALTCQPTQTVEIRGSSLSKQLSLCILLVIY